MRKAKLGGKMVCDGEGVAERLSRDFGKIVSHEDRLDSHIRRWPNRLHSRILSRADKGGLVGADILEAPRRLSTLRRQNSRGLRTISRIRTSKEHESECYSRYGLKPSIPLTSQVKSIPADAIPCGKKKGHIMPAIAR